MTYDRETAQGIFRQHVLAAMDKAANEIFGPSVTRSDAGATDQDLPRLFKCLDEQLDDLAERFKHPLRDGYVDASSRPASDPYR